MCLSVSVSVHVCLDMSACLYPHGMRTCANRQASMHTNACVHAYVRQALRMRTFKILQ